MDIITLALYLQQFIFCSFFKGFTEWLVIRYKQLIRWPTFWLLEICCSLQESESGQGTISMKSWACVLCKYLIDSWRWQQIFSSQNFGHRFNYFYLNTMSNTASDWYLNINNLICSLIQTALLTLNTFFNTNSFNLVSCFWFFNWSINNICVI